MKYHKPAGNDDCLLSIPGWIVGHDFSMGGYILRRQLGQFIGLCVYPSQRLHFLNKETAWSLFMRTIPGVVIIHR